MRIVSLTCAFLVLFVTQALAITSKNIDNIKAAQEYGKSKMQEPFKEFLLPWISYEEKAVTLNDAAEHAYLYTAFLLTATDAREKNLRGQAVSVADGERILTDYADLLSFSTVLFGEKQDFVQNAKVVLKQNGRVIAAYQINVPDTAEKVSQDPAAAAVFKAQCYFYFLEKEIQPEMPIVLAITTSDKREHSFYFDIAKLQ